MILETNRLLLRKFVLEDAPFILDLVNSEGWLRYIGDRNIKTIEQALEYLKKGPLSTYEKYGYGLSMVLRKEDQVPVGMCGILHRDWLLIPDIGFALLPEFQGKGYALEIVRAVLHFTEDNYGFDKIGAITLKENLKSIQLLEKLAFRFTKTVYSPGSTDQLLLYSRS